MRIKDIAKMAGVSAGTVDRVIHQRGSVSEKSRVAIEKVLEKVKYEPNLHLSSISLKKEYHIIITIPYFKKGEYWSQIEQGCMIAIQEYEKINFKCEFVCYDQYDLYSCKTAFTKIVEKSPDAVVIGPIFKDETFIFAQQLESKEIPYIFVDSFVYGTSPIAYYGIDQQKCGVLIGKLIDQIVPNGSDIVVFQTIRIGDESANNTTVRKLGFTEYINKYTDRNILSTVFSPMDMEQSYVLLDSFFEKHPDVQGGVVLSSKGSHIAQYIADRPNIKLGLICFDLTDLNRQGVDSGTISYLICQRPIEQGYKAIKSLMMYMVFGKKDNRENKLPIDIITKENLEFYSETIE